LLAAMRLSAAMPPQVVLGSRLSCYPQPIGDLWPADAKGHGAVGQHGQLGVQCHLAYFDHAAAWGFARLTSVIVGGALWRVPWSPGLLTR
jgi:hypothetical protein